MVELRKNEFYFLQGGQVKNKVPLKDQITEAPEVMAPATSGKGVLK